MGGEERVEKSLEAGLHGFDALRGRLLTKEGIQANHGAEEGYGAAEKRDVMRIGSAQGCERER